MPLEFLVYPWVSGISLHSLSTLISTLPTRALAIHHDAIVGCRLFLPIAQVLSLPNQIELKKVGRTVPSATRSVKLDTPFSDGVPEILPVLLLRLSPAGSEPKPNGRDHVSGRVPPVAVGVKEYGTLRVPPGMVVLMSVKAGAIVTA